MKNLKKILCFLILILCGCNNFFIISKSEVTENIKVTINYPNTGIYKLDKQISKYVNKIYKDFKNKYKNSKNESELNIDYEYIENNDITVLIHTYINSADFIFNDTKTFTYKKTKTTDVFNINDLKESSKIYNVDPYMKVVALTFDDGPSKYTSSILDVLDEYDARATFFVLGNKVEVYKDTLNKIILNGNEIGNHTYNHKWLSKLSTNEIKSQIEKTQDLIYKYTNYTPILLRPTYGSINNKIKKTTDLKIVLWDVDSLDWKLKNSTKIYNRVKDDINDLDIVLFHDTYKTTVESLKKLIPYLKEKGFQFVTISELYEIKNLRGYK